MKTSEAHNQRSRAFTLIELLVVAAIIAILASIVFPVFVSVQNRARRTEAITTMENVRLALTSYWADYTDWPPAFLVGVAASDDARIEADRGATPPTPGKWRDVYKTLIADESAEFLAINNRRRIVYINLGQYLDNKTSPTLATTFLDPWGHEYNIAIDSNGDGRIDGLPNKATGRMDLTLNATMVLWSYGRDPKDIREYVVNWK